MRDVAKETGTAVDGRTERGRQTREKIADALLALLDEGASQFAADAVAERAGVSRRLVFHHFADMNQLIEAAIARRLADLARQVKPLPTSGSREERVAALTAQRARILEWATPTRLAVERLDHQSERIREVQASIFAEARDRLAEVLAPELSRLPEPARTELLNGLDAVTTWGAWHHWRSSGLSAEAAQAVMASTVHTLLRSTDHGTAYG